MHVGGSGGPGRLGVYVARRCGGVCSRSGSGRFRHGVGGRCLRLGLQLSLDGEATVIDEQTLWLCRKQAKALTSALSRWPVNVDAIGEHLDIPTFTKIPEKQE